jgi:gamma-tubulin complex component 6
MLAARNPLNFELPVQKWSFIKSEQKRVEIQGLMDLSLQRSSCESDPFKERLFIYMRQQAVSFDALTCGICCLFCCLCLLCWWFDF